MPRFESATEAYKEAVTILQIRRGAKAQGYEYHEPGGPGDAHPDGVLDAITIINVAERSDPHFLLLDYLMPRPSTPVTWNGWKYHQAENALKKFTCGLHCLRFIDGCKHYALCRKKKC